MLCTCALLSRLHQDSVKTPDIYNPNITINDIRKRTITILCRKRFGRCTCNVIFNIIKTKWSIDASIF